ncbi:putative membrane protein YqjE [Azospirillum agricola]|nr:putative membrane protein YqjE [Azospirillum agricola]
MFERVVHTPLLGGIAVLIAAFILATLTALPF